MKAPAELTRTYTTHQGTWVHFMRVAFPCVFLVFGAAAWFLSDESCCMAGFAGLLFIVSFVGLSFNNFTVIDFQHRQVRRLTTGFWGIPGRERVYDFTDFTRVEATSSEGSSPYGIRLRRGWRMYDLKYDYRGKKSIVEEAHGLAIQMNIVFEDYT